MVGETQTAGNDTANSGHSAAVGWTDVTAAQPCPVCKKSKWCRISNGGQYLACRGQVSSHPQFGQGKLKHDKNGDECYIFCLQSGGRKNCRSWPEPKHSHTESGGQVADADTLHRVYSRFLDHCNLTTEHCEALERRGWKRDAARKCGLRSLNRRRCTAVNHLIKEGMEAELPRVPGFYVNDKGERKFWSVLTPGGILIPIRDERRRVVALSVRLDKPTRSAKYLWLSSKSKGGVSPGARVHVPLFDGEKLRVRLTEGALKAEITTA